MFSKNIHLSQRESMHESERLRESCKRDIEQIASKMADARKRFAEVGQRIDDARRDRELIKKRMMEIQVLLCPSIFK